MATRLDLAALHRARGPREAAVAEMERACRLLRGLGATRYDGVLTALAGDLGVVLPA